MKEGIPKNRILEYLNEFFLFLPAFPFYNSYFFVSES